MSRISPLLSILRKCLIVLIPLWLIVWGIASLVAPKVFDRALPRIQGKAKSMGVVIENVECQNIKVSPWLNAVTAYGVSADFDLVSGDRNEFLSSFHCQKIQVKLRNPFTLRGSVSMVDFDAKFHNSDRPKELPFDKFTEGQLLLASVPLISPREAIQELLAGVRELFQKNNVEGGFEFSGTVGVKVGPKNVPAKIYTEREGDNFRLRFSEDDIVKVAKEMRIQLSDDQVEMLSLYPLRIPLIAVITTRAREISLKHYGGDHWKQDALRHTAWSFMLTEAFGPEFSKIATDAQETKPGNEHFERLMDYNNNAVGRAFVLEKVKLQDIPRLVIEDPRVVLSPDDAKFRPAGQLLK